MTVREARPEDSPAILAILQASAEAGTWSADDLRLPGRRCWVADSPAGVRGVLLASVAVEGESEILTLAVDPRARRQGIASALLRALLRERPGPIFLEVRPSNTAARQLYQRLGFEVVGRRPGYYSHPPEDAVAMRLQPRDTCDSFELAE
jgi:ribosomal-protein-alanine N-acetyltransferase